MEQTILDQVNSVIACVNETIQAAKEQNDSVVGTILIDEEHDELLTIAATPRGELLGSYVFHGGATHCQGNGFSTRTGGGFAGLYRQFLRNWHHSWQRDRTR